MAVETFRYANTTAKNFAIATIVWGITAFTVGVWIAFHIYLPAAATPDKPISVDSKQSHDPGGNETILIVEDEMSVRNLIQKTLQKLGYHLMTAADGEEAMKIIRDHPETIHLLLTDVVMPNMSGKELSEKIGMFHSETTICFMSGYTDDAVLRHGILNESVHFIQKPFTPHSLAKKIRKILDLPDGHDK